jgi:hypothetical protein
MPTSRDCGMTAAAGFDLMSIAGFHVAIET